MNIIGDIPEAFLETIKAALGKSWNDLSVQDWKKAYEIYEHFEKAQGRQPLSFSQFCLACEKKQSLGTSSLLKSAQQVIQETPDIKWIVKPLFAKGFFSILVGPPGHLKTFVALDLAISLTQGKECFGFYKPKSACKVLFIEGDFSRELLKERLLLLNKPMHEDFLEFVNLFDLPKVLDLAETEDQAFLRGLIRESECDFLILDSLTSFHCGDEVKAKEMKPVAVFLRNLAHEMGLHILICYHPRKKLPGEKRVFIDQDDISGTSLWSRLASLILTINKKEENIYLLSCAKTWFFQPPDVEICVDQGEESIFLKYSTGFSSQNKISFAKKWILDHGIGLKRKEIVERLKSQDISERTIDRALERLKQEGKISIQESTIIRQEQVWI